MNNKKHIESTNPQRIVQFHKPKLDLIVQIVGRLIVGASTLITENIKNQELQISGESNRQISRDYKYILQYIGINGSQLIRVQSDKIENYNQSEENIQISNNSCIMLKSRYHYSNKLLHMNEIVSLLTIQQVGFDFKKLKAHLIKIIKEACLFNEAKPTILMDKQDPNSHFQKLVTCIHRYIKKICREATAIKNNNQQYILIETIKQQSSNQTQIIEITKKWVAETPMTIKTLCFQGNEQKYIIVFIDYDCLT
ncbi:hypothetical protein ABPG72_017975 [Tetrahymena utriculariae]